LTPFTYKEQVVRTAASVQLLQVKLF